MHSIYAQSYLNISADCAKDARDGLFQSRAAMAIQPLELHLPGIDETIHLSVDERNLFNWVSDAPLSQRAWVFQERHLARRILHFTEDEIVWECCAKAPLFASETFPNGLPLSRIFDNKPKLQAGGLLNSSSTSPEELYNLWEDLCQMYSEKNLSNASDKLIALFGLAKMFQTYFPDDVYVAGMWLSTLPRLLLWDVEGGPPITRITGVAPSWSWASIDGPIREKYRFKEPSENRLSIVCKVNISNSGSISGDSSESIQVSGLGIDGYIRRIIIHDNLLQDNVFPPSFDNRRSLILHDGSRQVTFADVNFSYSLDSNVESGTTEAHLLFVTVKSRKPSNRSDLFQGLLLHESQKADAFERIGTFSIVDNGAMKALVTALKYTVKEEIEDWEQAWEEFKDEHSIGRPRSIHGHSESGGSLGRSSLGEGDSVQSDAMQDESNNKNSNKSDLDLPIENLTLQTDESRSNVSDSDVSDSNVSDSNSTLDNHQRSTDEEISEEANDESEPDVGPNPDDTIQPDPADITAVLYDYEDGIDNSFFERLAPRKIVLI
ncbi:MAG: hypothetical protein LQ351_004273 [Letrouitia transgressa]|nr:MAG: hypothetical protein LQ351_004273 [Letrouitia transgressa]